MKQVQLTIYPKTITKFIKIEGGCWLWTGYLRKNGYAGIKRNKQRFPAHRWMYEYLFGEVESYLVLDHLCRVRHCVNPMHLEPVTNRENIMRGNGIAAQNSRKTHCKHGHLLSGDNLLISNGWRYCRECMKKKNRERYLKRKAYARLNFV